MIQDNIKGILSKIEAVCRRIGRDPSTIVLVGVTKFADIAKIKEALNFGVTHIAENKVQEAQKKFLSLENLPLLVPRWRIAWIRCDCPAERTDCSAGGTAETCAGTAEEPPRRRGRAAFGMNGRCQEPVEIPNGFTENRTSFKIRSIFGNVIIGLSRWDSWQDRRKFSVRHHSDDGIKVVQPTKLCV